jgi:hypothetical protein
MLLGVEVCFVRFSSWSAGQRRYRNLDTPESTAALKDGVHDLAMRRPNEILSRSRLGSKAMKRRKSNVFLIGESVQGSSLAASMDRREFECSFATSCGDAFLSLRNREFDLVLSPTRLRDGTLYPIMGLLEGSGATLFYSYPVERGCWWLPALQRGEKCFGSPALRHGEFILLLDGLMKQIRRDALAAAEVQPVLILPIPASVAPVLAPAIVRAGELDLAKRKAAGD